MANRNALIARLVRLGIIYGPIAYRGLLKNKGAVQELTRRQTHPRNHEAMAFEHAAQLIDGSVMPVFDGDTRVYVVFSGSTPVATHPVVRTPLDKLLAHYDMSRRLRPDQENTTAESFGAASHHLPAAADRAGTWRRRLAGRGRLRRRTTPSDSPVRGGQAGFPAVSDLPTVRRGTGRPGETPGDSQ